MRYKFSICLLMFYYTASLAQEENLGLFKFSKATGGESTNVTVKYNTQTQLYTFSSGASHDDNGSRYIYRKINGDFIITANFEYNKANISGNEKEIGFLIQETESENSPNVAAILKNDGSTLMKISNTEKSPFQVSAPKFNYKTLQIERQNNKITMRAAHYGEPLQEISTQTLKLNQSVLVGLYSSAGKQLEDTIAKVWNVRLDKTVPDNYNPGEQGYLGSRLETLNVLNGERKVIYTANKRFEAPNWMPGGQKLLFNMDGLIYTIPVQGGKISQLNTGFADNNNNDHGISFNGKLLAISHHRQGFPGGGSTIYILPLEGGTPELVTEETPSYWHGWAPNNQEVVYVASRKGKAGFDIYKKSIKGGKEIKLTDTHEKEHVDGPEYSPDGNYIYYNGSASGTMQIWRMLADGSEKEQITFDADNDWFPHISPNGKWIVYISFPPEIPVNDHPSYKRVTLKLIPAGGGPPRIIAYLYGGQGTINVPSWSPDSKFISFVSNF